MTVSNLMIHSQHGTSGGVVKCLESWSSDKLHTPLTRHVTNDVFSGCTTDVQVVPPYKSAELCSEATKLLHTQQPQVMQLPNQTAAASYKHIVPVQPVALSWQLPPRTVLPVLQSSPVQPPSVLVHLQAQQESCSMTLEQQLRLRAWVQPASAARVGMRAFDKVYVSGHASMS